ncbi:MAG: glycosyltransferase family 4 protein [Verrucomicrobiae bacterium]|nr:glycosyltransferase family 4 protein [Verrucomicrobiae bacterium]
MRIFYPYPEEITFKKAREIQTIHTCHALAQCGHEVILGVAYNADVSRQRIFDYFNLPPLPNLKFVFLPRYIRFTKTFAVSFQAVFLRALRDFISANRQDQPVELIYTRHLKVAEFCLHEFADIPLVFESHEIFSLGQVDSPDKFQRLFDQENFVYSHVQGLVSISNNLMDYLHKHFTIRCPMVKAPDGVDLNLFGQLNPAEADPNQIIYTGSLFGWKGVDTVIKAMRYLPGQKLWILGGSPGEVAEKQRLTARWKVSGRCEFFGYMSRTDLAKPLAKAFIGVLPNHREEISERFTSPLKLFEYMAAGKAVVASDLPSIREILDEQTAFLCPPSSPRSLAQTIRKIYLQPELTRTRIEMARTRAKEFSWNRRATVISSFIREVLDHHRTATLRAA